MDPAFVGDAEPRTSWFAVGGLRHLTDQLIHIDSLGVIVV